MSPTYTKRSLL